MHIMTCRISLNLTAFYIFSIVIETGHIADISSVITGESNIITFVTSSVVGVSRAMGIAIINFTV